MGTTHRKAALTALLSAKRIFDRESAKNQEAPVDDFLEEMKAAVGPEEYERLVGEIDLSQSEYAEFFQ